MDIRAKKLHLAGAFVMVPASFKDDRGEFSKLFNKEVLALHGVRPVFIEEYLVRSKKYVLRGLHYQSGKHAQAKLATCIRGEVYDVIVDMRKGSRTYMKWEALTLSEANRKVLYVPRGFAHGYLCTKQDTLMLYQVDNSYYPAHECGLRWDDPALNIKWPIENPIVSEKDRRWPPILMKR